MFSALRGRARETCVLVLFVSAAFGQQTVNNASISGRVTDPSGAVVARCQGLCSADTNRHHDTKRTLRRDGRFRFSYLKVGQYRLTVQAPGFGDVSEMVNLTVGAAYELPISLELASNATNITVAEAANPLETARSEVAGTVTEKEVNQLPLNGRNFLDLALLVPGVSPTNTASNQLFAETSAVPGQGISMGSQRNFSNNFIVDGLSDNDDAAGLTGAFYGLDVVNEFQVVTSGGQAEFGRALGGYINVVTKSGTNDAPRRSVWLSSATAASMPPMRFRIRSCR